MDPGFTFALLALVFWGVGDFFIQRVARRIGDIEALGWIGLIGTVGLLPFAYRDLDMLFSPENAVILGALGLLTFVMAIFNLEALRRGKLAVIEVIMEIELPITILLALFFFAESLSWSEWLLVGTIFTGILLMAVRPEEMRRHFKIEKGVLLALVAAVGMGAVNFLTASGARVSSPILAVWVPWVIFTLMCLILLWFRGGVRGFFAHATRYPRLILGMGVLDSLAWLFFALATARAELSITIAVTEGYPAIGVLLGVLINHEKVSARQLLGALLAIAGSIAIGTVN